MDNITDKSVRIQTAAVMRAAFKIPAAKQERKKPETHAARLKTEHANAAASLLEGIDEMFTVNDLGLTPALIRCLATTNIVENPNGTLRVITRCASRWRDGDMIERWAALAYLEAERRFRKIQGYRDLWILAQAGVPSNWLIGRPKPLSLCTPPPEKASTERGTLPRALYQNVV